MPPAHVALLAPLGIPTSTILKLPRGLSHPTPLPPHSPPHSRGPSSGCPLTKPWGWHQALGGQSHLP